MRFWAILSQSQKIANSIQCLTKGLENKFKTYYSTFFHVQAFLPMTQSELELLLAVVTKKYKKKTITILTRFISQSNNNA